MEQYNWVRCILLLLLLLTNTAYTRAEQDQLVIRKIFFHSININMYFFCMSICFLWPIKVKNPKPIGLKFCVRPRMIPGKVYGCPELQKVVLLSIFVKFKKCAKKSVKIRELFFCYCFILYKEKMLTDRSTIKS